MAILQVHHAKELGELHEGNVALDGVATQSTTLENWSADRGIDGDRGLLQQYSGCAATAPGNSNPRWRLDLRDVYRVNRVVITNRFDCCTDRVNGAEIRIGNSLENNGNNNPLCAVILGIPAGQSFTYSCGGMVGHYVNVFRPGNEEILTLCEVEVYVEDICKQRAAVRMRFSSREDLTDFTVRENILQQLQSALASHISDFNLTWTQLPEKEKNRRGIWASTQTLTTT
ncbi:fucolectin-like [Triplophysa rosa]|uniref:fucolectin-like n=1 Tax=Triplophysa rosa TaxID=992332 RepID=UPI002545D114|nr:fucolectin-like [Triplophysa rosa]